MPSTRSQTKGVSTKSTFQPRSAKGSSNTTSGTKRKAAESTSKTESPKKAKREPKQAKLEPESGKVDKGAAKKEQREEDNDESVTINRAPVLELWASCVAHLLHPSLPWQTCLSVGSAISTIAAIAKGRSIGAIDKPDKDAQQQKQQRRKEEQAELDEVTVMGFNLRLQDGSAVVGDKSKKANEDTLKKKYGDSEYAKVKKTMEDALSDWKDNEDELDGRAFHMYEDFRPSVAAGQKGWGRKGQLSLKGIRDAVRRE